MEAEVRKPAEAVSYDGKEQIEKTTDVMKCPGCGANLHFDAVKQKLVCDHCGTETEIPANTNIREKDFVLSESDYQPWPNNEVTVYRCNNCGSAHMVGKHDIAMICPFCGTGNIIQTEELPGLKPDAVFPFTLDLGGCKNSCKAWLKRKFFVPSALKKKCDFTKLNGVYCPAFTFDSHTQSSYSGVLGEHYTVTVGSGKNRHTERRTRYFNISGSWWRFFDDVTVEAGPILDGKTYAELRPFDRRIAKVYNEKYLAGFTANHYDKGLNRSFGEAKAVMAEMLKSEILKQYSYDVVQSFNCNTRHDGVTFKYILLPVWVGNYTYNQKQYRFYVNGNSGKVCGKVPRSGWKILRFLGIMCAIVAALGLLVYFL